MMRAVDLSSPHDLNSNDKQELGNVSASNTTFGYIYVCVRARLSISSLKLL
uniref:Uncharacterized protein n=1 Tax=Solanum lycopersicum TaxID=4081 RepID=A0A3Q7H831_SOLLC